MNNAIEPAYPIQDTYHPNGQVEYGRPGLTKRELLAAMALQGMLANTDNSGRAEAYAKDAVAQADALLAALASAGSET